MKLWILNGGGGGGTTYDINAPTGTLFDYNAWGSSFGIRDIGGGTSYDINFPRGTLFDSQQLERDFSVRFNSHNYIESLDFAKRIADGKRYEAMFWTGLSLVGNGISLSLLVSAGTTAGVATVLSGGLAIPALMLGSYALYSMYQGNSPDAFKYFSLVSNLNQTAIFVGVSLIGTDQNKALDYSKYSSFAWKALNQGQYKINVMERRINSLEFSKRIMEKIEQSNQFDKITEKPEKIKTSVLP